MTTNKKPRKAYRPRPITLDTMKLARQQAAQLPVADRAEILGMLRQAIQALREGVANELQWSIAAGAVALALAIEHQGIVRGMHGHFKAVEQALQDIYDRAMRTGGGRWIRVTLYYTELDTLQTFLELHTFQLQQLGRAEFLAAIGHAQKRVIADGHTATVMFEIERMAA